MGLPSSSVSPIICGAYFGHGRATADLMNANDPIRSDQLQHNPPLHPELPATTTGRSHSTPHVLDGLMRIQNVAQAAKSWPDTKRAERKEGARLADNVEHIHWRLWHGQVQRALDLIGETLVTLEAIAETALPKAATAGKVADVLRALETYVFGQSALIINYATARGSDEPISTATTESTVQWLLHRRMGNNQQMRWSSRGAHLVLKVRTSVMNGTFHADYTTAERWAQRPFQRAA